MTNKQIKFERYTASFNKAEWSAIKDAKRIVRTEPLDHNQVRVTKLRPDCKLHRAHARSYSA